MKQMNYYEILGISEKATANEIKRAYYRLCKQYHPDINPKTANLFKNINEAYHTLIDENLRMRYDYELKNNNSNTKDNQAYTHDYYDNYNYYANPEKEPVIDILNSFWTYRFENAISAIWKRNIFVLFGNSLLCICIVCLSIFSKIYQKIYKKNFQFKSKVFGFNKYINKCISKFKITNYIIWTTLLSILTISKLIYHMAKIAYFIFYGILRYLLIPIILLVLGMLGAFKK